MIIELVDSKFKVVQSQQISDDATIFFKFIDPGLYSIRITVDENRNGKWDTGNFLFRRQPERVLYYPETLEVNAFWSLQQALFKVEYTPPYHSKTEGGFGGLQYVF